MAESQRTNSRKNTEGQALEGGKKFLVLFSRALPALDTAHARAYLAQRGSGNKNFIAYVCDRRLFPRLSVCETFARSNYSSVIQFVEWHTIRDTEGIERVVLIYKKPNTKLYLETLEETTNPISLRDCMKNFVQPVIKTLRLMHSTGITYRAFAPTNLFVQAGGTQKFILGQCLSEPAGMLQPRLFETPTAAMAEPQGRGSEIAANDYYALGVMVLTLLRGHVPLRMLSEEAVLMQKARLGSYRALIEHTPLEAESSELIRGLLDDNPATRWGFEKITSWLGGYRRAIDNHFSPPRAKAPYYLQEQTITTRQEMSYLLHRNWQEAVELFRRQDLSNWLRRSFSDDVSARGILILQGRGDSDKSKKNEASDGIIKSLMLLNPLAPILWQNMGCTVTAFGTMLARYHEEQSKAKVIINLLRKGIHDFWMRNYIHSQPTYVATVNMLNSLTRHLLQRDDEVNRLVFMYTLNQDAPCMSQLFSRDYVYGMENLISRLEERIAQQGDSGRIKLDAHILAYIAAYYRNDVSQYINAIIEGDDPIQSGLAQARMLNILQHNYERVPARAICKAVFPLLEPALERIKNVEKKQKLHTQLKECIKDGFIQPMLAIADNPSILEQDAREYIKAQKSYRINDQELYEIADKHRDMPSYTKQKSKAIALTTSSGLMVVGFIIILLRLL